MEHHGILPWAFLFAFLHLSNADVVPVTIPFDIYTGFIDTLSIDAEAPGIHNGLPAYYKQEFFNLTVYMHLNETWTDFGGAEHLTLYVKIPNENHVIGQTCEGELFDGQTFDCTTSADRVYDYYFNVEPSEISINISDNIFVDSGYPVIDPLDDGHLKIDFGPVYLLPVMTTTPSALDTYNSGKEKYICIL